MTAPAAPPLPPGCLTDPARPLTFTFQGRTVRAVQGQSIAAALYAAGVRVFSRSFKYHRPRGLFCVSGDCPNCLMHVDGRPNVRTCVEPARQGQVVRGQNAWPSLGFDLLRVFDRLSYFLPVGFYYKRFYKPRWMWPLFERVVRRIAGLGRIDVRSRPDADPEVEHLHAEVCVVGGGPAGLAAANAAAEAGADVLMLERLPVLGGHLLLGGKRPEDVPGLRSAPARNAERRRTLLDTTAFGLYEGNLLGAFCGDRLLKIRAREIIVATGARQQPALFANNDLPGVMLLDGVLRLARLYGVRAGRRAVLLAELGQEADWAADQLRELGIEPVSSIQYPFWDPNDSSSPVIQVRGNKHLRAVRQVEVNDRGKVIAMLEEDDCDLLCLATERVPANELLLQGGMRFRYLGGRWQPATSIAGLMAAGGAAGMMSLEAQMADGRLRGREAAARLGYVVPEPSGPIYPGSAFEAGPGTMEAIRASRDAGAGSRLGKQFVCLCEDVTVKDIEQAVAEGFDGIETLKRYSTVNMGPCQGKMCGATASALCARATGRELNTVGSTTSRPPAVPVDLAVLAAERRHHPVRRTPLHHWHAAHGARWMDAGQWKRPESYGDPEAEVRAVRTAVGLIDVSTLGKIEVTGPDASELLERVYVNEWANLAVGRARYGVMCTEEGIVFDDGIGARLGPEHFYVTATTGNADAVFQWLELWRATWGLKATVRNQTSELAAVNLAGPRARDVLGRLTALDLSSAAFPYPAVREATVAGVPCRLLRVGFVGELGYEIHCENAHSWHLWEALVGTGTDIVRAYGLKMFGVEAQRILRLEKGHLIVGQDTDATSNPLGAGLGRMVRFAKPRFHGREPLRRFRELPPRSRLVGFFLPQRAPKSGDNGWARQLEGCQVVEQGRPAGRVTSARYSPTLEKYLGLAWVPEARGVAGGEFLIRHAGADLPAQITSTPFYDPQGQRLKS
jgi:sarcosine oxidase subunit alpha